MLGQLADVDLGSGQCLARLPFALMAPRQRVGRSSFVLQSHIQLERLKASHPQQVDGHQQKAL